MPRPIDDPTSDAVTQAERLARDVAPDLGMVVLTHYPDAETLDTLRPGETDLATAQAVNRAVATEMMQAGVEVLVQRADRAAFRRWIAARDDTPAQRHAWLDRERLLRGAEAMAVLGLPAPDEADPPDSGLRFDKAPGPVADALLDAFADEDSAEFDGLVQALMAAGRTEVLDLAVRKLGERLGDEAGDELNWVLLVAAEGAAIGPSGWAELVALPVALGAGAVPDGEAVGQGLLESGALADTEAVRLLPGWRSPDALAVLSFGAVRRVLQDLVDGRPPQDLPPGDTDDLARRGFGVLVGLRIDWAIPSWTAIAAEGGLPEPPEEDAAETPDEAARAARFDRWRSAMFQGDEGCVPLALVEFSQVGNEIADFLAEAGEQTGGLEEIREFVAEGRRKSGGDVLCQAGAVGDGLELTLFTEGGRRLDSLALPASRLPVPAEEMPVLIGAFVRLVENGAEH